MAKKDKHPGLRTPRHCHICRRRDCGTRHGRLCRSAPSTGRMRSRAVSSHCCPCLQEKHEKSSTVDINQLNGLLEQCLNSSLRCATENVSICRATRTVSIQTGALQWDTTARCIRGDNSAGDAAAARAPSTICPVALSTTTTLTSTFLVLPPRSKVA